MESPTHPAECICVSCDVVRERRFQAKYGEAPPRPTTGHTVPVAKPVKAPVVDDVNRPAHYTSDPSGVECIQIVRHRNFNVGNAIKYLWRAGLKTSGNLDPLEKQLQDLEKARWYIADEMERLKKA